MQFGWFCSTPNRFPDPLRQELGMHCLRAQLSFLFGFSAFQLSVLSPQFSVLSSRFSVQFCSLCVNSLAQVRATFHRLPRATAAPKTPRRCSPLRWKTRHKLAIFLHSFFAVFPFGWEHFQFALQCTTGNSRRALFDSPFARFFLSGAKEIIRQANQGKEFNSQVSKWTTWPVAKANSIVLLLQVSQAKA